MKNNKMEINKFIFHLISKFIFKVKNFLLEEYIIIIMKTVKMIQYVYRIFIKVSFLERFYQKHFCNTYILY